MILKQVNFIDILIIINSPPPPFFFFPFRDVGQTQQCSQCSEGLIVQGIVSGPSIYKACLLH